MDFLNNIDSIISDILTSLGMYGPLLGSLLILVESILPVLPLSVFITLNFYAFGNLFGFFLSSILTIIGCNLAFYVSRRIFRGRLDKILVKFDQKKLTKITRSFYKIKLKNLVLIMAFPFTPAFLINIISGASKMDYNKFLIASIIAKPFMVYFWGYVGTTFLQSFTHPIYFLKITFLLLVAYILSSLVNKKFNLT